MTLIIVLCEDTASNTVSRSSYPYFLALRHSQGGIGESSTHRPRLTSLASLSNA